MFRTRDALSVLGLLLALGLSAPTPLQSPSAPRDYSRHSFVSVFPEDESARAFVVDSVSRNSNCEVLKTSHSDLGRPTHLFCSEVGAVTISLRSKGIRFETVAASENRNMDLAAADRSAGSQLRDIDFTDYFR